MTTPRPSASAKTIHSSTRSSSVSTASAVASRALTAWVAMTVRRRSQRSTRTPPINPNSSVGSACRAVAMPTATAESDSSRTSQSCATRCIQVPMTLTAWPAKNVR